MATKKAIPTVPMEQFGKDHWSLLGYIETCCVDGGGEIVHDRMRTNPDCNPDLGYRRTMFSTLEWKDEYSTRLKSFPWKSKREKEKGKNQGSGHEDGD